MRKLWLLCAGLVIVSGLLSVQLWRALSAERDLTAALRARTRETAERTPGSALPVQPPETAASVQKPVSSGNTQAGDRPVMPDIAQILANDAAVAKDPDYRKAGLARLRMTLPQDYPGLVEELGLTPEEAGKLFDLLAEVQMAKLDANTSNSFVPGQPGDVAAIQNIMRTRQEIQRRRDESLNALLGSARHKQFEEYEAGRPGRGRVEALARTLASADQPLSDLQVRALTPAYVAEEKRRQQLSQQLVGERQPGEPVDQLRIDEANLELQAESNRRILEAARAHLSARQLETLGAMLEQSLAQGRAALRVRRERSAAQGQ